MSTDDILTERLHRAEEADRRTETMSETTKVDDAFYQLTLAQRDGAWRELDALRIERDTLAAQLTEVTRERDDARAQIPTGRPDSDRLLLNAYGRECYEAGQQSALAPLRAVVEAAKGLVGKDGARPGNLRVPHVGPRTQEVPEAAWVALRDAIAAFPADPSAPTPEKEYTAQP